mgnify:FL=1
MNNLYLVKRMFSYYPYDIFAICADFRQRLEQLNHLKTIEKRNESKH